MTAGKVIGGILIFGLVIWVVIAIVVGIYVDYQYENAIGSYMEMSIDTITPESFKEQLILTKQAMTDAGLTEQDYGAMWFKKPDNSMKFQFQHIDSIIERTDAMIRWQETQYGSNNTQSALISGEAYRDVYNDKINQLRSYIKEGGVRSDWIAKDAWYVKNHPLVYLWWIFAIVWVFVLIIALVLIGVDNY